MPFLFLSPSTQEYNPYVTTGNEEYWMNALADAMEPSLRASGVNVTRNDPEKTVGNSIRMSNAGNYDFHLALHSNAAPEALAGKLRGIDIYHYPGSEAALRMARLLQENLAAVYPLPERVRILPTTALAELRGTRAPAVLCELGYHDNREDALWIENDLGDIARALCLSVSAYFGLPLLEPGRVLRAEASHGAGYLNLRGGPATTFPVLGRIPVGAALTVLNTYGDWYVADFGGLLGYVSAPFVTILGAG